MLVCRVILDSCQHLNLKLYQNPSCSYKLTEPNSCNFQNGHDIIVLFAYLIHERVSTATLKPGISFLWKQPCIIFSSGKYCFGTGIGNILGVECFCRNRFALSIFRLPKVAMQMQRQFGRPTLHDVIQLDRKTTHQNCEACSQRSHHW